jgi:zinc protease
MHRTLSVLGLLALAAAPAVADVIPGLHGFTLDNGLTVVVIEDRRAPVVIQTVWYRVGSADDPAGQSGVAHFLEHLMFKATDELQEGAFSRIVAENGGQDNAFTTTDYTGYIQRVAADRLDLVMGMEADRMVDLAPGEAGVLSERSVVIEERRQTTDSDPGARFFEETTAALYRNHPYGRPVIGWEQEIAALTPETAMAFYRAHYAPNNAILVIAGDAGVEEVRQLAEKHFGPIPASPSVRPRVRPQEPPHRAALRVEMHDPRMSESVLSRTYLAPARRPGEQSEAAALAVLAELLGGSSITSVMAREFLLGERRALQAEAGYRGIGVDSGSFSLVVVPSPGIGLAETEAALDALIARVVETGPDAAQLERVKGQVRASEIYALDDPYGQADRVGTALATGLTLDDVEAWPGFLQAVTPEDVQAAARSVFRIENSVTGWLSPPDAAAPEPAR